jgi:ankyrin repeat protein
MPKALPPQPHIDWLKKAAKERLAELRARDPDAKLHQAQRDVAQEYGFASWRALKAHVDTASLDGQIVAATTEGRAADLARLLDAHPQKLSLTGGQWKVPLLHLAAEHGRLDCVDVLLARGFDVNTRDRLDHASALHWAAANGHIPVIDRLLAAGIDIDGEGDDHEIGVLGWATCFKHVQRAAGEHLLARGAKPTIFSAVALDRGDLVRQLVEDNRALLAAKMSPLERHRTSLHLAVLKNRPAMVTLLLELGADPAAKDDRGNTPLHYAASKKDKTIADMLIAGGADPKLREVNRFESLIPIFGVRDMAAAIGYYEAKLGFQKEWGWGDPPTFACVMRDDARLFLSRVDNPSRATVYIAVNNVDALYEDYRKRGPNGLKGPENYPWGNREIELLDLDGHRLIIASEAGVTTPETEE